MGRVLNAAPLALVGLISYSLYLWQQPFLNRDGHAVWMAFPLNLALATLCGQRVERSRRPSVSTALVVPEPNIAGPAGA